MRITKLAIALCLTLSGLSLAAQPKRLNMQSGHTTTLSMPAPVSRVTVADPQLVEVSQRGRQVVLVGRAAGSTEVTVQTADGEMHLQVYVAADKYGLPN